MQSSDSCDSRCGSIAAAGSGSVRRSISGRVQRASRDEGMGRRAGRTTSGDIAGEVSGGKKTGIRDVSWRLSGLDLSELAAERGRGGISKV